ncbi:hypothetical protein G6O45_23045, partial [Salmonella enterica subsp. enterica serovar Istanbul]|nr:hypothetical protein [Salmonella enterica subsp. enterica serovar Istanbul]
IATPVDALTFAPGSMSTVAPARIVMLVGICLPSFHVSLPISVPPAGAGVTGAAGGRSSFGFFVVDPGAGVGVVLGVLLLPGIGV